ncbi:MAG: serine/threonine-protein kinase [Sandaracinaceae bacterium]
MKPGEPLADSIELDADTLRLSGFKSGAFFADRYRLEELLGVGAMGKVFRAFDQREQRRVALKVLHPEKASKSQVLARFRQEALVLRELGHPGIVRILDSGISEGIDYLTMELLEGTNLKDYIRDHGPMTPEEYLPLLVQVCDALGAAHTQDVIHRDLKPENLFLTESEEGLKVKVVDFGLSRVSNNNRMTKTGVMLGTPRYMAPEQIRSARDVDLRTDIYALGVITHEALAGASPFPAGDAGQLLGCVIEGRILRLEDERPQVPGELANVVRRAMAKDKKDRFATIGAFAEAFAAALGMRSGRSGLTDTSDFQSFFSDAEHTIKGTLPVDLPDEVVPASYERARFTLPPSPPHGEDGAGRDELAPPQRRGLAVVGFIVLFVVVAALSAASALAIREYLRSRAAPASSAEPAQ